MGVRRPVVPAAAPVGSFGVPIVADTASARDGVAVGSAGPFGGVIRNRRPLPVSAGEAFDAPKGDFTALWPAVTGRASARAAGAAHATPITHLWLDADAKGARSVRVKHPATAEAVSFRQVDLRDTGGNSSRRVHGHHGLNLTRGQGASWILDLLPLPALKCKVSTEESDDRI